MKLDVDLDGLSPERAARAWGRKMAETIVSAIQATEARPELANALAGAPQLSPNGQAPATPAPVVTAAPPVTPATPAAPATPGAPVPQLPPGARRPVDPPEVFDRLKAEAKEDALKIKQFLRPNLSDGPMWELGKRIEEGKDATWAIVQKWAAKDPDAGFQGRGGYMTPFEIFINYLQMQTFTVSEWGVDQWTSSFELAFDKLSDSRCDQFKAWIKARGGGSKDDQPRGMVHFDVGQVLKDAGEVYLEVGGALLTGGSNVVAKIAYWLVHDLPGLIKQAQAVLNFVDKIREVKFDDVKKFLSPTGIGQLLASALFGKAGTLPTVGEAQDDKKEKEERSASEAGGLLALLRKILTVVDVIKRAYSKVAEAVNAGLAKLDITKQGWFDAFSMAYAAVVHAVKTIENPGPALSKASETLKGLVGGFFQTIKEKIADIASGIKTGLDLAGRGKKLIADLADKAVEMVVNFLVKHNPSALIKTALKVLETASNKSVVELLRTEVKYGDDILKAISESSVVRTLLSPLERPIAAVSEMTDTVAEEATSVVSSVEKEAVELVGDGAKMVTEIAGVNPQASGAEAAADAAPSAKVTAAGGGDASTFLGALKAGIHAGLLELGTASLIKHGKQLGKAAVEKGKELGRAAVEKGKEVGKAALEKGTAAAKGLVAKLIGPKVPFTVGKEQHEVWVEDREGKAVVLMASDDPATIDADKIQLFESHLKDVTDPGRRKEARKLLDRLWELTQDVDVSARKKRSIERQKKQIAQTLEKLLFDVPSLRDIKEALKKAEKGEVPQDEQPKPADLRRMPESRLDIEGKKVGGVPEKPGQILRRDVVQRANRVLGVRLGGNNNAAPQAVVDAWERANAARRPGLTATNWPDEYVNAQRAFWRAVRRDAAARQFFRDGGFVFPEEIPAAVWRGRGQEPAKGGAPILEAAAASDVDIEEFRITLDHVRPKSTGDNWRFAVDGDNLELRMHADNSKLQHLETKLAELRRQ